MANASTIALIPLMLAFLMFIARFYIKEGAPSVLRPSFILAFATVLIVGAYLLLGVLKMLPEYATAGFGGLGIAMLALSIYRMFTI